VARTVAKSTPVVRKHYISAALENFAQLTKVLPELTEAEIFACLDLEAASLRRRSLINRLISRAGRLAEISLTRQLKEKYHGDN
jgi:hypothetical protein